MSDSFAGVKSIFGSAMELRSPEEREAYLARVCGDDHRLRAEVESLLQAAQQAGGFFDGLRPPLDETADESPEAEHPGTVIGPYKLLEQIGEGGFGVVFMAEQERPVYRKVALKVLKPGMDTRQVVARFEAERQALALMDHPNIAHIHDGGTTAAGRPYFVMELVRGVPTTDYCDQSQLTVPARLELFIRVCQAVQHAHTKGVIHRDLKPSNVLVTMHDDKPVPKVIDFGVAKALGQRLTDKTLFTGVGQMVGTPPYMSPEQAEVSGLDVDTRSDVYSLGVLLYELLTGTTPFDGERLRTAGYDEMRRIIREEEPARPSSRVSTLDQTATTVSANRGTDPRRLSRLCRGELDWIVMKALEKDRNRRYETANGFAMDVQRYLSDEPVLAGPPSTTYRLHKFLRRNKGPALMTTVVLLALFLGGSTWVWLTLKETARVAAAEELAAQDLNEAERLMRKGDNWPEAKALVTRAEGLLESGGGAELRQRMRQLLSDLEMLMRLEDVRLQEANVRDDRPDTTQADAEYKRVFEEHGIDVETPDPQEAAARIRARAIWVELAAALDDWARVRREMPKGSARGWQHLVEVARLADSDDRRNQLRNALERRDREALVRLAVSDQTLQWPAPTLALLGRALQESGATEEAVALLRKAQQRQPGDFWINQRLGWALTQLKSAQLDEAIRFFTAAVAIRNKSPGAHLNLGAALLSKGELDDAIAAFQQAVRLKADYANAYINLGAALLSKGELAAAAAACREAIRLKPDFAETHCNLGRALQGMGESDAAVAACREAIRLKPDLAEAHNVLGANLADRGESEAAIAAFREAIRLKSDYAEAHSNLGLALACKGDPDAAAACRQAIRLKPNLAGAHANLGFALLAKGEPTAAAAACREAIRLKPDVETTHNTLGLALARQGQPEAAIAAYREAIRLKPDLAGAHSNLGRALLGKGESDAAAAACREAIRLKPDLAEAHNNLGASLASKGEPEAAAAAYREAIRLKPDLAEAHNNLGTSLADKGESNAAIAAFREAIRLKFDYAEAHSNLGRALLGKGESDAAEAACREAIRLKPDYAEAHNNLGLSLARKGESSAAITAFNEAIIYKPTFADAQCNLGLVLLRAGQFTDALRALRRGHELGSKKAMWRHPSDRWVRECERLVALDARLLAVLRDDTAPADDAERLEFARLCALKQLQSAAARFYKDAFTASTGLAANLGAGHRYRAACAAALAGTGQGKDADQLDEPGRVRWRRQALDWLRADLALLAKQLQAKASQDRSVAQRILQEWRRIPELANVRESTALSKLPDAERDTWREFWTDVAKTLATAAEATKEPGMKQQSGGSLQKDSSPK